MGICMLDKTPGKYSVCNSETCLTCGWDATEMLRRIKYLRCHGLDGLTRGPDGKRRLIINRIGADDGADATAEENAAPGTDTPKDG